MFKSYFLAIVFDYTHGPEEVGAGISAAGPRFIGSTGMMCLVAVIATFSCSVTQIYLVTGYGTLFKFSTILIHKV